jgi:branched-chain amino acid transport system permease protein
MDQVISNLSVLASAPVIGLGRVIDDLMIGALFAPAAYGLALVWGVANVNNLAQGDFRASASVLSRGA